MTLFTGDGMRNRAHVAKILELHKLDSRQRGRQQSCDPVSRWRRALAHHVEHRNIEATESLQGCGFSEQGMRPSAHIRHRRGNRCLAFLGGVHPGSGSHPVVDESLGGCVLVARVEGGARVSHYVADSFGFVRRGCLRIEQREQRWFVQGHCTYTTGVGQGRDQRDRGAIGMSNQRQWRAGSREHRLDERDLVAKMNDPVRRPLRALAGVIRIGSEDAKRRREKVHQRAPLPRGARIRMGCIPRPGPAPASRKKRFCRGFMRAQCRVITISRYSLGTTMVPSPERLNRSINAMRSRWSAACAAGSSAAKVLSTGP